MLQPSLLTPLILLPLIFYHYYCHHYSSPLLLLLPLLLPLLHLSPRTPTTITIYPTSLTIASLHCPLLQPYPAMPQSTHYSMLSTFEILGKLMFAAFSGLLTDTYGYPASFCLFSVAMVAILPWYLTCSIRDENEQKILMPDDLVVEVREENSTTSGMASGMSSTTTSGMSSTTTSGTSSTATTAATTTVVAGSHEKVE